MAKIVDIHDFSNCSIFYKSLLNLSDLLNKKLTTLLCLMEWSYKTDYV